MFVYIKELIVVLGLSIPAFAFAKSTALHFTDEADFRRRRNVWLVLTVAAFLSPTFWWFALVAVPLLYWGGKKDTNPLAFYLLLMNVIPPLSVEIPAVGVNRLFGLNIFRLLSLCVLIPAAWRLRKSQSQVENPRGLNFLLLAFGLLQVVLYVPPDQANGIILHNSSTNALREAFLFLIDVYVLYYVASRLSIDRRGVRDAMAAFVLSCTVMALLAVFESAKHWLLYTDLNMRWGGSPLDSEYLARGGLVRAQVSSGHPLVLGYLLAVALGFWLYLKSLLKEQALPKVAVTALLVMGLIVSFSRGPWGGGVAIYLGYAAFCPGAKSRLIRSAAVFLVIGGAILLSPLGDRVTSVLPYTGTHAAQASLTYRERLVDRSWELIEARPFFGDQLALWKMQDLRQGQGIIDVVNAYVNVTLFYGFVGLSVFLAFIIGAFNQARRTSSLLAQSDPDLARIGASIAACILGTLLMLADCGLDLGYAIMFYVLAGLASLCLRLRLHESRSAAPLHDITALPSPRSLEC